MGSKLILLWMAEGFLDQPQDGKTMEAVGDVGLLFTTGYSRIKMEHGRLWIVLAFVVVYLAGHVEVRLVGWELGRSILALQYCLQHSTRHDEICHTIPTAAVSLILNEELIEDRLVNRSLEKGLLWGFKKDSDRILSAVAQDLMARRTGWF
ncbi:hypothetical protein KIW84_030187 [Lathyrus oleraceus]|uniref:Uncharacterized protein n=1 Tax=Pisum sativum TaxID=3888 RepID=A0A9D4XNZ4_PEA|nr:hypothetical protein KIW84_030187 [Pisum sativum]